MIGLAVLGIFAGVLMGIQAAYESGSSVDDTLLGEILPWMLPMIVGGAVLGNSLYIFDILGR